MSSAPPSRASTKPRDSQPTIAVVFPALDEAAALPWVLGRVPAGYEVLVVDNGSTDGTPEIARSLGARVVKEPQRGFGAACWAGLLAATADIVCFCDADASLDPTDLPRIADPVVNDLADLVLGARQASRGAWPVHARLANKLLTIELRRRIGHELRDLGPMRAARRSELLGLGLRDRRFGWPLEMVLRASAAGWRLCEIDVGYRRRTGRSKVTGTIRGTARTILDMTGTLRAAR
jgi:glycosyltransferase involved in cell wall biosynthesis